MIMITFKCNQCTLLNRSVTTATNSTSIKLIISYNKSENEYKELKAPLIKEKK